METGPTIRGAGVSLYQAGDVGDAVGRLLCIAEMPAHADDLRSRQRAAFERTFAWDRLAEVVEETL